MMIVMIHSRSIATKFYSKNAFACGWTEKNVGLERHDSNGTHCESHCVLCVCVCVCCGDHKATAAKRICKYLTRNACQDKMTAAQRRMTNTVCGAWLTLAVSNPSVIMSACRPNPCDHGVWFLRTHTIHTTTLHIRICMANELWRYVYNHFKPGCEQFDARAALPQHNVEQ